MQISSHVVQLINHVAEVRRSNRELSQRIDEVEQRLSARIDEVEQRLSARIDEVEQKLSARIDESNERLDETNKRLDETNSRLNEANNRIERLDVSFSVRMKHYIDFTFDTMKQLSLRIEQEAAERKAEVAALRLESAMGEKAPD